MRTPGERDDTCRGDDTSGTGGGVREALCLQCFRRDGGFLFPRTGMGAFRRSGESVLDNLQPNNLRQFRTGKLCGMRKKPACILTNPTSIVKFRSEWYSTAQHG